MREHAEEAAFAVAVGAFAFARNLAAFVTLLGEREVGGIVRSIARWTWARRERFAGARRIVRRGATDFAPLRSVIEATLRCEAVAERRGAAPRATQARTLQAAGQSIAATAVARIA